jgi:uncharacterized protein YcbX
MQVAELWRYPVKSMAGERLSSTPVALDGMPGDRTHYVIDGQGEILSGRTRPLLLAHQGTVDLDGNVLVDSLPWDSPQAATIIHEAAGPGARIVQAGGAERFDILPLLVVTDGAIEAFGYDYRRLRPNLVLSGVPGLTERTWEDRQLQIADAVIGLATLRDRCIITTWDPDTNTQDVEVLRHIRRSFGGSLALNAWAGKAGRISVGDEVLLLVKPARLARPQLGRLAR